MPRPVYTPEQADELRQKARRYGLESDPSFWNASPEQLSRVLNGIGPDWFPDWLREKITDHLDRFAEAAGIHDWDYYLSLGKVDEFNAVNFRFLRNCRQTIRKTVSVFRWSKREELYVTADLLYGAVCTGGWPGYAAGANKAEGV